MDHKDVAKRILRAVGGEDNIVAVAHCATRLRMVLKDPGIVDVQALDEDPDLKGTFESGGMFQIIVGPGDVNVVFDELNNLTHKDLAVSPDELKDVVSKQGNWFSRAVKVLADIFVPLIPILVGGGLLMAINNILTAHNLFGPESLVEMYPQIDGMAQMISLMASAPFAFLPVLVGFTATKRFGGNEFLGAGMAMAMVMPSLVNGYEVAEAIESGTMEYWSVFGLHVAQAGYQGTILPILVVSFILATIEKFFHRHLRGTVDFLVTPVLTLLITGFLTFTIVGPVMRFLGDELAVGLFHLYELGGPVGGFIFGLIYTPIVITGLHQSFPPFEAMLWTQGGSFIFATASVANIAQGAVALAVFALTKNEKLKGLAGASGVSSIFGISEPAIFGVNLRLRWPFYIGMGAAGIGGMLIALFGVKATALGAAGIIGFVSLDPVDIPMFFVCALVTFALAFGAAYGYGRYLLAQNGSIELDKAAKKTSAQEEQVEDEPVPVSVASEDALEVFAPLTGDIIPLSAVSDPMFAQGKLGAGVAIVPSQGVLAAPVSGKVVVAFPSGHAFAVRTQGADGRNVDILMHVGFNTVDLQGAHFNPKVKQGQLVEVGQPLMEFDIEAIKEAGYEVTTPIVISNSKRTGPVIPAPNMEIPGQVEIGQEILSVDPHVTAVEA